MSLISILKKKNKTTLFTTPSHDGKIFMYHKFYQWYKADISETETHNPQKALENAEKKAAKIYNTKFTKFLTNGSSSGIISAILTCKPKNILIWNMAHPCHKNGAKLANANIIEYSLPLDEELGIHKAITPQKVEELLLQNTADTIVITTPTYEGFVADIQEISRICKSKNVKLITDEAHGALYPFSENLPESAIKYADFTIQSLHKTAGGINPTALLHSQCVDPTEALKMISTTSPSYPMLATIEANINFLNSKRGKRILETLINNIKKLNLPKYNDDITKILLKGGYELSEKLFNKYNIEDERTNDKTTLLLCGIGTNLKKLERLKKITK
ncbi:MAG: aminotransferase class I/II-fold pyridoxal phosphate-dependent enzyme [Cyanobacteria bacterium SIG28]|nr:aminotransferase class I/II-fold pyridoxal phosphate-dependent enzyme [Cyanobacteria bacterium SIG28]